MEIRTLTQEENRTMQLLELDMLKELDRVCRKNHIPYTIFGGTMLGAVRHRGFIPWDDDADICMLREDYERFKSVSDQLNPSVCFFQDHTTDPEYRWGYGKLRRSGTSYVRAGQEHLKCKTGVFIDVFPMDDIPRSIPGQMLNCFHCFCLRKTLWSEVGKLNEKNPLVRLLFRGLSHVRPETVFHKLERMTRRSQNDSDNPVRCLLFPPTGTLYRKNSLKTRYGMPKSWFLDLKEYEFEGVPLYGTADYDTILKYIYGDYWKLPPEEKRVSHSPVSSFHF